MNRRTKQATNNYYVKEYAYRKSNPYTGLDCPLGPKKDEAPSISRQPAHEGGKVVSLTHRPPLPPGNILGNHFC